jgi:hypothetical protein
LKKEKRCFWVPGRLFPKRGAFPVAKLASQTTTIDYVGIIGACGGLITALSGFFQTGNGTASFAFLFLSFLLFWLMFKNKSVSKIYLISASVFLAASLFCVYSVNFQTFHLLIRRTVPLNSELKYPVYIVPGNKDISYSKDLSLSVSNQATVTIDLNKADMQILSYVQELKNKIYQLDGLNRTRLAPATQHPLSREEAETLLTSLATALHAPARPMTASVAEKPAATSTLPIMQ